MKDKTYKAKQFRLSEETHKNLYKIKNSENKSWNMVFYELIKLHNSSNIKNNMKLNLEENKECPYCKIGIIKIKQSKFGKFLACDNFPRCGATQAIKESLGVGQVGYKD